MNHPVQACAMITKELYDLVVQQKNEEERDEYIQQIHVLLEKRDEILSQLNPPFTPEQEQLGKQMSEWNKVIGEYFKKDLIKVQTDIQGVNKKKSNMQKYINPYEALQSDGAFYDKKN